MADLTPEALAEWRKDVRQGRGRGLREANRRILTLLDALDDAERTIAKMTDAFELAEALAEEVAGLSRMHVESVEYGDRLRAQFERADAEREHFAQVARDTFQELKTVTAERDAAEARHNAICATTDQWRDQQARAEQAEIDLRQMEGSRAYWKRTAERSEAALSRVLADVETLGMRADGIVDTDGGRWVPCADILDLIEKYQNVKETND